MIIKDYNDWRGFFHIGQEKGMWDQKHKVLIFKVEPFKVELLLETTNFILNDDKTISIVTDLDDLIEGELHVYMIYLCDYRLNTDMVKHELDRVSEHIDDRSWFKGYGFPTNVNHS